MRPATSPSLLAALVVGLVLVAADAAADSVEARAVARLDDEMIVCPESFDAIQRCAARFLRRMMTVAERAYVADAGLDATDAEIEDVRRYDAAFRIHDRSQRSRKLIELNRRLADDTLEAKERARLEEFRAVLVRLARYEADVDAGVEPAAEPPRHELARWVEEAKLNAALHGRFGGTVGINAAGPYAHGARLALLSDYLRSRDFRVLKQEFGTAIDQALAAPPAIVFKDATPDFTPFWQRPIPTSYVVD